MSQWNAIVAVVGLSACQSKAPISGAAVDAEVDSEVETDIEMGHGSDTDESSTGPNVNPPPPAKLEINEVSEGAVGRLNAQSADFGLVFHSQRRHCFVQIPSNTPLSPGQMGPTRSLDCPDSMNNTAFEKCVFGIVVRNEDTSCSCLPLGGNPPPPDFQVPCPESNLQK